MSEFIPPYQIDDVSDISISLIDSDLPVNRRVLVKSDIAV